MRSFKTHKKIKANMINASEMISMDEMITFHDPSVSGTFNQITNRLPLARHIVVFGFGTPVL
ncbi:25394_t:CDS:2, partial [Gigaspora rosea]